MKGGMSGGPYSHAWRPLASGDVQCRVCGLVAASAHDGPGCPTSVDRGRVMRAADHRLTGAREFERATQEFWRAQQQREGGGNE